MYENTISKYEQDYCKRSTFSFNLRPIRRRACGHFVDEASIRYNYEEGLKNLDYFSGRFDNLEIVDVSKGPGELNSLLKIKRHQLVYLNVDLPIGLAHIVINIADRFRDNSRDKDNDEEQDMGYRRGR